MKHSRIRLRECLELYEQRTGRRLSYRELAKRSGVSENTLESIASRPSYNATLKTIDKICNALGVSPAEMLAWER